MSDKKQHITIHDIAKELGVSASTVSRALKQSPRISIATRNAVRKLAEKYNYLPNTMASSLRNGRGNTVGVVVPNIHRSFFSNIIGGMEEVLSEAGYNLMICQSHENLDKEKEAIATLVRARVDGILMSLSMESDRYEHIEALINSDIRMVFFDRIPPGMDVRSVIIDDYLAAYKITGHLIAGGYRRLAHVGGSQKINVYSERQRGFLEAMNRHELEIPDQFIVHEEMTLEGGKRAYSRLMEHNEPPDAVICSGDFAALGVMLAAKECGRSIPEELAVSGFADEDFTQYITPSLTTINQRGNEIGRLVAKQFLVGEEEEMEKQITLEPELIFRDSTKRVLIKNR